MMNGEAMLELYKKDSCPFCQYVMYFIKDQGRTDIVMRDIVEDEANRLRLIEVGGKQQVPCLFIDGNPLYESRDIVAWLAAHDESSL